MHVHEWERGCGRRGTSRLLLSGEPEAGLHPRTPRSRTELHHPGAPVLICLNKNMPIDQKPPLAFVNTLNI